MKHHVYAIKCLENNCMYIGKSKDYDLRIKSHIAALGKGCHPNREMQKDYDICGETSFVHGMIASSADDPCERSYIEKYSRVFSMYNKIMPLGSKTSKFSQWIDENGLTQIEVAARLAMDKGRLNRILSGSQDPTLFQVAAIYDMTKGRVCLDDWLNRVKPKKKRKKK